MTESTAQPSLKTQTIVASVALAFLLAAFVGSLLLFVKP